MKNNTYLPDWYALKRGSLSVPLNSPFVDLTNPEEVKRYQKTVDARQKAIKKCIAAYRVN